MVAFEKLFRAPYGVPNALERVDDGLWISDQISDRIALVDIAEPGHNATGPACLLAWGWGSIFEGMYLEHS